MAVVHQDGDSALVPCTPLPVTAALALPPPGYEGKPPKRCRHSALKKGILLLPKTPGVEVEAGWEVGGVERKEGL